MKNANKIISIILSLLICISALNCSFSALAAEDSTWGDEASFESAYSESVVPDKSSYGISTYAVTGTYPERKGVILVTDVNESSLNLPITGHAAIVYSKDYVVESIGKGVVKGKNNWDKEKPSLWGVTVKSTTSAQDAKAADWCYKKIGCKYNFIVTDTSTRKRFYCSQLVWASFYDLYGIDLNSGNKIIFPSELVSSPLTKTIYQKTK